MAALLALALAGAACAGPERAAESMSPTESRSSMADSLQIIQGTTADHEGTRLALAGADGQGGARLDAWNQRDEAWLTHWRVQQDQVFPAGGGFLRVLAIQHGARAILTLAPPADSGGITAPAADQPVLPMGGSLDVGQTRIELVAAPEGGTARARLWPKLYPLDRTDADKIREMELSVGETLEIGTRKLKVERIQADAGDISAFVAFSTQP